MKKKLVKIVAAVAAVGIVAGNASSVVYAHHSRRAVTVQTASCYQNGYCTGNGSCDVNGVCQNGGVCTGTVCYQDGSYGVNYSYHHHGHH